jgi:hypothetical protein
MHFTDSFTCTGYSCLFPSSGIGSYLQGGIFFMDNIKENLPCFEKIKPKKLHSDKNTIKY